MRRLITTIVLSLLAVNLSCNDGLPNPRRFLKKVYFPIIETPTVFTSTVDHKEYLVFIEHSDSLHIN